MPLWVVHWKSQDGKSGVLPRLIGKPEKDILEMAQESFGFVNQVAFVEMAGMAGVDTERSTTVKSVPVSSQVSEPQEAKIFKHPRMETVTSHVEAPPRVLVPEADPDLTDTQIEEASAQIREQSIREWLERVLGKEEFAQADEWAKSTGANIYAVDKILSTGERPWRPMA